MKLYPLRPSWPLCFHIQKSYFSSQYFQMMSQEIKQYVNKRLPNVSLTNETKYTCAQMGKTNSSNWCCLWESQNQSEGLDPQILDQSLWSSDLNYCVQYYWLKLILTWPDPKYMNYYWRLIIYRVLLLIICDVTDMYGATCHSKNINSKGNPMKPPARHKFHRPIVHSIVPRSPKYP